MAQLDQILTEQKISTEDYEKLSEQERMEIFREIFNNIARILSCVESPGLGVIGTTIERFEEDPSRAPEGLVRVLATDSLAALYVIGSRTGLSKEQTEIAFSKFISDLSQQPETELYNIYMFSDINPKTGKKLEPRMKGFTAQAFSILNTSNIKHIDNPKLLLYYVVCSMSYIYDSNKLLNAIKNRNVFFGAMDMLYNVISHRSVAAARTAILEFSGENPKTAFRDLPKDKQELINAVDSIDDTFEIEKLFRYLEED